MKLRLVVGAIAAFVLVAGCGNAQESGPDEESEQAVDGKPYP